MARIVLTTFGSLGDLHPYLALAQELRARGHQPVLATLEGYRAKIEGEGIAFLPVRPDVPDPDADPEFTRRVMNLHTGPRTVVRDIMMAHVRDSYADLSEAVRGADLLVTHPITYAGPILAQKMGIRWVSTVLSPLSFLSAYEPAALPIPGFDRLYRLGPRLHGALLRGCQRLSRAWGDEGRRLRAELGVPPGEDPIFAGQHSPERVLALFSRVLGEPQPDWPPQTRVTGFAFYDRGEEPGLPADLSQFLASGPPPVVFTLGSAAVLIAGDFYRESVEAARRLDMRAVLLTGRDPRNRPKAMPDDMMACDYAPYSAIMPRAAAIVHQGGVGTTAQALRAGRPMLVVPYSHDQPDNAARVTRLGVGRTLPRGRYNASRAVNDLRYLLSEAHYADRAHEVGARVQAEEGTRRAVDSIEELLT
jgi:UDP:flavonoid glycosyltransferase YjiC (YdhE family)